MIRLNTLAVSHKIGGGNFGHSRLTPGANATKKGRPASFFGVLPAVLFVFSAPWLLSPFSGDEEDSTPATADYPSVTKNSKSADTPLTFASEDRVLVLKNK